MIIKKKYKTVRIIPISVYGYSTGFAPIHVSNITTLINSQKLIFFMGLNFLFIFFFLSEINIKANIELPMANTPPSLDGMARRIA